MWILYGFLLWIFLVVLILVFFTGCDKVSK
jgi:hypothetical protein